MLVAIKAKQSRNAKRFVIRLIKDVIHFLTVRGTKGEAAIYLTRN